MSPNETQQESSTLATSFYRQRGKRWLDLMLASTALVLLAPLLCVISIAIASGSRGPVLFRQDRVGKNGRLFACWKFRTMYTTNVHKAIAEKAEELSSQGVLLKPENDPRITPVGRWLRRTSLDELPQLVNVLRGEMSLVGPRPLVPFLVAGHPDANRIRSRVSPGLTGYWQISARNECTSVLQMIDHDARYIDEISLVTDLKTIARTLPTILSGEGAR